MIQDTRIFKIHREVLLKQVTIESKSYLGALGHNESFLLLQDFFFLVFSVQHFCCLLAIVLSEFILPDK